MIWTSPGTLTSSKFIGQTSIPQWKIECTKLLKEVFVLFLRLIMALEGKKENTDFCLISLEKLFSGGLWKSHTHPDCQGQWDPRNWPGRCLPNYQIFSSFCDPSTRACPFLALHPLPSPHSSPPKAPAPQGEHILGPKDISKKQRRSPSMSVLLKNTQMLKNKGDGGRATVRNKRKISCSFPKSSSQTRLKVHWSEILKQKCFIYKFGAKPYTLSWSLVWGDL